MSPGVVELFKGVDGKWRWRHVGRNHRVIDPSGQSFYSKWNAKRAAKRAHPGVNIQVIR